VRPHQGAGAEWKVGSHGKSSNMSLGLSQAETWREAYAGSLERKDYE
jgi:hypothetical protein